MFYCMFYFTCDRSFIVVVTYWTLDRQPAATDCELVTFSITERSCWKSGTALWHRSVHKPAAICRRRAHESHVSSSTLGRIDRTRKSRRRSLPTFSKRRDASIRSGQSGRNEFFMCRSTTRGTATSEYTNRSSSSSSSSSSLVLHDNRAPVPLILPVSFLSITTILNIHFQERTGVYNIISPGKFRSADARFTV